MIKDRSLTSRIFDICNILFLILFSCSILYPFIYIFSLSISDHMAIAQGRVVLLPVGFNTLAYKVTFRNPMIWQAYFNTILYAVTGTSLSLLMLSLTAYPMSVKGLYGKKVLMIYFIITMFFSGGLIPIYLLIIRLGMYDTIWAMIIPWALSPWSMIIVRTNFMQIPDGITESVKMDGGKSLTILFRIILPMSKPVLATFGLFNMVGYWNMFFTPFIFLRTGSKMPLQVYLRNLIVNPETSDGSLNDAIGLLGGVAMPSPERAGLLIALSMAAILVSIGPIIIVYPFIQKYFVKGLIVGSLKG